MKPALSIIIPTKDRGEIFTKTLETTLQAIRHIDAEIIVVNDSETPLQVPAYPNVRVLRNPKTGVASGRNFGVTQALSDFILFMDDDFLIDEEAIRLTFDLKKEHPDRIYLLNWDYPPETLERMKVQKFGRFLISHHWTSLRGWLKADNWNDQTPFPINGGASYFLPVTREEFEKVGGYNEQFPHAGAEDHDFCQRLIKTGKTFYVYPGKVIYHNESDRTDLKAFVHRRKRSAITHRIAADLGYKELAIHYSRSKYLLFSFVHHFSPLLLQFAMLVPNNKAFDGIYNKAVSVLIGCMIFEGYQLTTP